MPCRIRGKWYLLIGMPITDVVGVVMSVGRCLEWVVATLRCFPLARVIAVAPVVAMSPTPRSSYRAIRVTQALALVS